MSGFFFPLILRRVITRGCRRETFRHLGLKRVCSDFVFIQTHLQSIKNDKYQLNCKLIISSQQIGLYIFNNSWYALFCLKSIFENVCIEILYLKYIYMLLNFQNTKPEIRIIKIFDSNKICLILSKYVYLKY